jgi:hypothetical protein
MFEHMWENKFTSFKYKLWYSLFDHKQYSINIGMEWIEDQKFKININEFFLNTSIKPIYMYYMLNHYGFHHCCSNDTFEIYTTEGPAFSKYVLKYEYTLNQFRWNHLSFFFERNLIISDIDMIHQHYSLDPDYNIVKLNKSIAWYKEHEMKTVKEYYNDNNIDTKLQEIISFQMFGRKARDNDRWTFYSFYLKLSSLFCINGPFDLLIQILNLNIPYITNEKIEDVKKRLFKEQKYFAVMYIEHGFSKLIITYTTEISFTATYMGLKSPSPITYEYQSFSKLIESERLTDKTALQII